MSPTRTKCMVCGYIPKHWKGRMGVFEHVRKFHGIARKEYYDRYFKTKEEGVCKVCKQDTPWSESHTRYPKVCNFKCTLNGLWKKQSYINKRKRVATDRMTNNWRNKEFRCMMISVLSKKGKERCKSDEWKERNSRLSVRLLRDPNSNWGKRYSAYGLQIPCGKVLMRSKFEVSFAKSLSDRGIEWEYEPKTFRFSWRRYTPDFYLPRTKEYVELRPSLFVDSLLKRKLRAVRAQGCKITLVTEKNMASFINSREIQTAKRDNEDQR